MSEIREDTTQIIKTVTGPQPHREQEGVEDKKAVLRALASTGPVTQDLEAQVTAHILQGHSVAQTLDALRPQRSVGQAPVRSPDQRVRGVVKTIHRDITKKERKDLETGETTPDRIIAEEPTGIISPIPTEKGDLRVIPRMYARRAPRPPQR